MLEMVRHHRILGLILDEKLNWKEHLKARERKKLNLFKTLAHKEWREGPEDTSKNTPNGCLIDSKASKAALRTIEPVHHRECAL
jgi:hypothetical protein